MNRLQLRAPAHLRRRPLRARRLAVAHDEPLEYSAGRPASRWLVVGTPLLGFAVLAELLFGIAVLA